MRTHLRTRGSMILAACLAMLLGGVASARSPIPTGTPGVSNPPGTVHGCHHHCRCTNSCGCTGPNRGQPPGGGSSMPEPATLVSGLIGMGLAGVFGWRRKKAVAA